MESLKETSIAQIKPIPGLYISDRFAARSRLLLRSLGITHILSVTQEEDVPPLNSSANPNADPDIKQIQYVMKHIPIYDDPTEDILIHLEDACDWIQNCLSTFSPTNKDNDNANEATEKEKNGGGGVLVHCTQGISRSGAVIVAYRTY
ncbi:hypothetical protein G7Y89_g6635 [Cudoniella acicularis]|uniref:Protein-tyrosine-phosphatase n=1 Tax=Cudoniella acicularis TaxID=354080 RepID=A0A8H4W5B5_9HELO|nr:hypothetical protein G7Y89_g6635 [Cudoniella acicularis]